MPDHNLPLSKAAAVELATLASSRGLLTKPVHIRKVTRFVRENLAPRLQEKRAFDLDEAQAEFGVFTINEKTRDGLKELMRCAAEKGALACTIGTDELLDLFGLAED